ncbi:restriction endonuclease subunit S [Leptolyngbyaceae cyanobacterium UHCC 1019]
MAVWSIINFSELPGLRTDPEYYQPYYLELEEKLKAADPACIDDFAFVTDGIHGSPEWVEEDGVRYLSAKCVKDNYFALTDAGQISKKQNQKNPRTQAQMGDVLLTTVGTIGNAAVVNEDILPANMDRHLGIIRISNQADVDPYYVATFLNSEFGRFQTLREATGNVQLNLFIDKIKKLLVPIGDRFNKIGNLARQAYDKRRESEALYAEAEELLLHELGLDAIDLSPQTTYTANFSQTIEAKRTDAEYWGTQYTNLINYLKDKPHERLAHIATFSNGATPKGAEYLETGIPFLRIQNVVKNRIDLDEVVCISDAVHHGLLKRSQLQPDDVLITITGRIGTAAVVPETISIGNMNQHSVRLRLTNKQINPYYLSTFLNSKAGLLQTERESYGSTRDALPYYCLGKLIIPTVSQSLQEQVEIKIRQANNALEEAKSLLQESKQQVEEMILREG